MSDLAVSVAGLFHKYGARTALAGLSLEIKAGEIFAVLGPNGSGKTTLFRLLSTLIPPQAGTAHILGFDVRRETMSVRRRLGVVFQSASIDRKLTVAENLRHRGRLHGLGGELRRQREEELLTRLALTDRRHDLVETLSGGLRRRVELACGMLHRPQVLLLDEPSTGLDPAARSDLWQYLSLVRRESGMTIILTTHLLDEAERADRIAILHEGSLVALDTPAALRASVGGDSITIRTPQPQALAADIRRDLKVDVLELDNSLRLEQPDGHIWVSRLIEQYGPRIEAVTLGKPSLEDVFIDRTGHRFWARNDEA